MIDRENKYDVIDFYWEELCKITKAGDLSDKGLEASYKLADIIKDLYEACEKEAEMDYDEGASQRGYSRRRSMGRPYYMNESYEGRSGNYSYGSSRDSIIDHLQTMVDNSKNEPDRMMYSRWLDEAMRRPR